MALFGLSSGRNKFVEFYNHCTSYYGYGCQFLLKNADPGISNVFRTDDNNIFIVCKEYGYVPAKEDTEGMAPIQYLLHPSFLDSPFYQMICGPVIQFGEALSFNMTGFGTKYYFSITPDGISSGGSATGKLTFNITGGAGEIEIYKNFSVNIRVKNSDFIRSIFTNTYMNISAVDFYFRPSNTSLNSNALYPFWDADYFRNAGGKILYDDTIKNGHKDIIFKVSGSAMKSNALDSSLTNGNNEPISGRPPMSLEEELTVDEICTERFNDLYDVCKSYIGYGCVFTHDDGKIENIFLADDDMLYDVNSTNGYTVGSLENHVACLYHYDKFDSEKAKPFFQCSVDFNSTSEFILRIVDTSKKLVIKPRFRRKNDCSIANLFCDGKLFGTYRVTDFGIMSIEFDIDNIPDYELDSAQVSMYFRPSHTKIDDDQRYPFYYENCRVLRKTDIRFVDEDGYVYNGLSDVGTVDCIANGTMYNKNLKKQVPLSKTPYISKKFYDNLLFNNSKMVTDYATKVCGLEANRHNLCKYFGKYDSLLSIGFGAALDDTNILKFYVFCASDKDLCCFNADKDFDIMCNPNITDEVDWYDGPNSDDYYKVCLSALIPYNDGTILFGISQDDDEDEDLPVYRFTYSPELSYNGTCSNALLFCNGIQIGVISLWNSISLHMYICDTDIIKAVFPEIFSNVKAICVYFRPWLKEKDDNGEFDLDKNKLLPFYDINRYMLCIMDDGDSDD